MDNQRDPLLDFRAFLYLVWTHLRLPEPTRRQYYIAHYLQHGPKRKVIMAFRGIGKSWITAAYVLWRLYHDQTLNIVVISASKARADNFTTFCLRLIKEIPVLNFLMPRDGQRCSKIMFDVGPAPASQTASVVSKGIGSQITGDRADIVIADDVEVPNNSATQMMREKLSEQIKEFDSILKPLPTSEIIFLGTPQTEDSIYSKLAERKFETRIWPVRYPTPEHRRNYGARLSPDIAAELDADPSLVGSSTESGRFSDERLSTIEIAYGRAGFALQFMLDTSLSDIDRYPLKLSDLVFFDLDAEVGPDKVIWSSSPEYALSGLPNVGMTGDRMFMAALFKEVKYQSYQGIVMAIDPSGRGKDETAYAVVAHINGQVCLLDAGGFSDGYTPQTLTTLCQIAARYKVTRILIEANFGDGMFTALLKPYLSKIYPCSTEETKAVGQKEKRIIDVLEPVMQQHRLVVNKALIKKDFESTLNRPEEGRERDIYRLFYQLTRITRDRGALVHDDRLDALAMAVAYFTRQMQQDVDKAVEQAKAQALDDELKKFMEHTLGLTMSNGPVWVRLNR